jgi:hypothetical protein
VAYQSYRDLDIYKKATLCESKSLSDTEKYEYFCEEYDHLGKMISDFIKSVDGGHKTRI